MTIDHVSDHVTLKSTRCVNGKWDLEFKIYAVMTMEQKAFVEKEIDAMLKRMDEVM